jgi:cobalt/nickel transport system permease protein
MHIPDGYLGPSTCAALFAGAAPFWAVALRRLRRSLHTRVIPRLSLFAAFAFVVMMFNIPLPGGTTGHATGAALAAIVLGPSAAILAVSVALVIQAVFFGDGGITAIGANCFNMAVVGSLVGYGVYRLVAAGAALTSTRRVVAAAAAGYVAANAAALVTAVEFGLQPILYHDAAGAPLYCPYPLTVAVPAMMIGHLTVAGIAELVLTGGVVAFLQRRDAPLLAASLGREAREERASAQPTDAPAPSLRPLWTALGVLLVLTPLGVLAAGTAWGEWAAADFADPHARASIAAASMNAAPPTQVPSGMARLSSVWTAPIADYAPSFVRNEALGYALSAMFGTGLVILAAAALGALTRGRGTAGRAAP